MKKHLVKENKAENNQYLSVAECQIESNIKIADFNYYFVRVKICLSQDMIMQFRSEYGIDIRGMYILICNFLTNPNYKAKEIDYAFSLAF